MQTRSMIRTRKHEEINILWIWSLNRIIDEFISLFSAVSLETRRREIKVIVEKWFLSVSFEATGAAIDHDFIFSREWEKWEYSELHIKANLLNFHEIISLIYFHC